MKHVMIIAPPTQENFGKTFRSPETSTSVAFPPKKFLFDSSPLFIITACNILSPQLLPNLLIITTRKKSIEKNLRKNL